MTTARSPILISVLTCPKCGAKHTGTMPQDACQYFYQCSVCKEVIKPKPGDCCVYCSYGTVKCPFKQEGGDRCC